MSFILDALRKSENERREQASPTLAAGPQAASTKKRTIWLPILAVVLAMNAIVFGTIVLTRDEATTVVAPTPPPAKREVRSLRKESVVDTAPAMHVDASAPASQTPSTGPVPIAPAAPVAATKPDPESSGAIQSGLPSLGQMRAAGLVSVANLHIDMHVYSGDAAKRFVFINMTKYREGDRLTEGPTIEEITSDGIILVQQGNRFVLHRD